MKTGGKKEDLMLHKNICNRRFVTENKVKRKAYIWGFTIGGKLDEADLGALRKGKVHCSCPMCAAKTNGSINKSGGPVDGGSAVRKGHGTRLSVTNGRYGRKSYSASDRRKVDRMAYCE